VGVQTFEQQSQRAVFKNARAVRSREKIRIMRRAITSSKQPRKVGLARALSKLGFCSRSRASELIRAGQVTLNGAVRRDPETPVNVAADRIEVAAQRVAAQEKVYFLLNKPRGIITTASDEKGRDTVYAFLPPHTPWLAPVGRLDKASEGLLLLTNDSEWAARILHPETHLDKTYHVQIVASGAALADARLIDRLAQGFADRAGDFLSVKRASILRQGQRNAWLEIVLDSGKNRHIRRMVEHLGIEVLRLIRISIGGVALGELRKGSVRPLAPHEKQALDRAMGLPSSSTVTRTHSTKLERHNTRSSGILSR
jgi:23S rRNA pseudouridine2605 synthase